MSNTHKEEKLRLAEAPDNTKVWDRDEDNDWELLSSVSWSPSCKYVVDDGIHITERKAFAEGKSIKVYMRDKDVWVFDDNPKWHKDAKYKVAVHKSVYETRWKMIRDLSNYTESTNNYYGQSLIDRNYSKSDGWRKGESIEVEVKL